MAALLRYSSRRCPRLDRDWHIGRLPDPECCHVRLDFSGCGLSLRRVADGGPGPCDAQDATREQIHRPGDHRHRVRRCGSGVGRRCDAPADDRQQPVLLLLRQHQLPDSDISCARSHRACPMARARHRPGARHLLLPPELAPAVRGRRGRGPALRESVQPVLGLCVLRCFRLSLRPASAL